jgi:hypothetical protein
LKARIDQGHIYLFFGKNRRRLKAIYYDVDCGRINIFTICH